MTKRKIENEAAELPTLDELAKAQNAKPITDVRVLFGTWPGDGDDGFEESIEKLRHQQYE